MATPLNPVAELQQAFNFFARTTDTRTIYNIPQVTSALSRVQLAATYNKAPIGSQQLLLIQKISWHWNACIRSISSATIEPLIVKISKKIEALEKETAHPTMTLEPILEGLSFLAHSPEARNLRRETPSATRFKINNSKSFSATSQLIVKIREGKYGPKLLQKLFSGTSFMHVKEVFFKVLLLDHIVNDKPIEEVEWFQKLDRAQVVSLKATYAEFYEKTAELTPQEALYLIVFRQKQVPEALITLLGNLIGQIGFTPAEYKLFLEITRPLFAPSQPYLQEVAKKYLTSNRIDEALQVTGICSDEKERKTTQIFILKDAFARNFNLTILHRFQDQPEMCIEALTDHLPQHAKSIETIQAFLTELKNIFPITSPVFHALLSHMLIYFATNHLHQLSEPQAARQAIVDFLTPVPAKANSFEKILFEYQMALSHNNVPVLIHCKSFVNAYCDRFGDAAMPSVSLHRLAFHAATFEKNRIDMEHFLTFYTRLDPVSRLYLLQNIAFTLSAINETKDTLALFQLIVTNLPDANGRAFLTNCGRNYMYNKVNTNEHLVVREDLILSCFSAANELDSTQFLSLYQPLDACERFSFLQNVAFVLCKDQSTPRLAVNRLQKLFPVLNALSDPNQPDINASYLLLMGFHFLLMQDNSGDVEQQLRSHITHPLVQKHIKCMEIPLNMVIQRRVQIALLTGVLNGFRID